MLCCVPTLCCAVQYDLDDNGKLDSNEFVKMLQSLGTDVSKDEADAAMEVGATAESALPVCQSWCACWGNAQHPEFTQMPESPNV